MAKKNIAMIIAAVFFVTSIVCLFISKSNYAVTPKPWVKYGGGSDTLSNKVREIHYRLVHEVQDAKPQVLFVGDSITANWTEDTLGRPSWDKYFAPLHSFDTGIGGIGTQFLLWRLHNGAVDNISPKVIVRMIGSNNAVVNTPQDTVQGIVTVVGLLKAKLPKAKILLVGILPRWIMPDDSKDKDSWIRKNIRQINSAIATLRNDKLEFIDISETILDANGIVNSELVPGGVHPSQKGYERMAPPIAAALNKLLN